MIKRGEKATPVLYIRATSMLFRGGVSKTCWYNQWYNILDILPSGQCLRGGLSPPTGANRIASTQAVDVNYGLSLPIQVLSANACLPFEPHRFIANQRECGKRNKKSLCSLFSKRGNAISFDEEKMRLRLRLIRGKRNLRPFSAWKWVTPQPTRLLSSSTNFYPPDFWSTRRTQLAATTPR